MNTKVCPFNLSSKVSYKKLVKLTKDYKLLTNGCHYLYNLSCKPIVSNNTTISSPLIANKQGHQKRISQQTINDTIAALQDSSILSRSYNDFEELYDNVEKIIYHIPGIGRLTLYDISVRIGANLLQSPVFPRDFVYLHAGALLGAKRLFGVKSLLFRIQTSCFPAVLQQLGSLDIENFLCIFKDQLP